MSKTCCLRLLPGKATTREWDRPPDAHHGAVSFDYDNRIYADFFSVDRT